QFAVLGSVGGAGAERVGEREQGVGGQAGGQLVGQTRGRRARNEERREGRQKQRQPEPPRCPSPGGPGTTSPRRRAGKDNIRSSEWSRFHLYKNSDSVTVSDNHCYDRQTRLILTAARGGEAGRIVLGGPPARRAWEASA